MNYNKNIQSSKIDNTKMVKFSRYRFLSKDQLTKPEIILNMIRYSNSLGISLQVSRELRVNNGVRQETTM